MVIVKRLHRYKAGMIQTFSSHFKSEILKRPLLQNHNMNESGCLEDWFSDNIGFLSLRLPILIIVI